MEENGFATIGSVAGELGLPRWKLSYLVERGDVPGPSLVVPGRRLFSPDDVEEIRRALDGLRSGSRVGTPDVRDDVRGGER